LSLFHDGIAAASMLLYLVVLILLVVLMLLVLLMLLLLLRCAHKLSSLQLLTHQLLSLAAIFITHYMGSVTPTNKPQLLIGLPKEVAASLGTPCLYSPSCREGESSRKLSY